MVSLPNHDLMLKGMGAELDEAHGNPFVKLRGCVRECPSLWFGRLTMTHVSKNTRNKKPRFLRAF
jgi:hypothetical protein